jgi:hypothetical protein
MVLRNEWDVERTWGSNQPVLKGITEIVKPEHSVECGCGYFSTPIFSLNSSDLTTIEHDRNWAQKVMNDFPEHEYIIYPISGAKNGTPSDEISSNTMMGLNAFYLNMSKEINGIDVLLVDTFRCARVPAALFLAPLSDIVIVHDVRPSSREYYQYHKLDKMFENWVHYEHRPEGFINKAHMIPWTAVYCRTPLDLDKVNPIVKTDSERLWDQSIGLEEM